MKTHTSNQSFCMWRCPLDLWSLARQERHHSRLSKITRAILLGCALLSLSACSGDDDLKGYIPDTETIKIVENSLLFQATGSSATVEVSTPVTATVDAPWCSATADGTIVTVTAEANTSFEGRTALLTLTSAYATRTLPIQQLGMVLDIMPASDRYAPMEGDDFTYTVRHDLPMNVATSDSWLHATIEGNQLHITVDANDAGHIRYGQVTTESVGIGDTLTIAQYDLYNDIVGSYYIMGYYGGDTSQPAGTRFDLIERNDSLFMHWSTGTGRYENTYIHVPFDRASATLTFYSAFTLFSGNGATDTGYFYDTNGYLCTSRQAGVRCKMNYSEQSGYNTAIMTTYNWPGHTVHGFIIRSVSIVSQTLMQLSNIVFVRVGPEGTKLNA